MAAYFNPHDEEVVECELNGGAALQTLIEDVLRLSSGRGHPALELRREDGSSLSIGTDGSRACLVWTNALGDSFHSLGIGESGPVVVYDYFGSWSEAPASVLVPLAAAVDSARQFLRNGVPDTASVIFSPD
jgi:Immunity protein Imm1